LRFEAVYFDRQFGWRDHIGKKHELPALKLRAVAEIEIFRERVVLPAATGVDARAAPNTRSAVEIKKTSTAAARRLLEQMRAGEKHRLHAREQRISAIDVAPARLDHADHRIGEKLNRFAQDVRRRDKIGVEN